MSVNDGQRVNAAVTNAAYISRTTDSDTVAVVGLNNASSGGTIANAQQAINDNATNIASNDIDIATLQATKQDLTEKGQANGYAELDGSGKVPSAQLPTDIVNLKGNWNATTNTPTLIDGTGDDGDVYIVSVAGTQDLGSGNITFAIGDWAFYNGGVWEKVINSNTVQSVNGQSGVVVLDLDDINDVDLTTTPPVLGDHLEYDGTDWVPGTPPSIGTLNYVTKVAGYTLTSSDDVVTFTNGATDYTATLPAVASVATGKTFVIRKLDSGAGKVIVDGNGAETIDGSATFELRQQYNFVEIINNGTSWEIINLDVSEYLETIIESRPQTTVADTWVPSTEKITLRPGVWEIGYHVCVRVTNTAGTNSVYSSLRLYNDSDSTVVPDSYSNQFLVESATGTDMRSLSQSVEVTLTAEKDFDIQIVSNVASAAANSFIEDSDITGLITGDHNTSKIWARRVK